MKTFKTISLYIQYMGARFFIFLIGFVPYTLASKIGYGLGILTSKIMRGRFRRSVRDIQKAFPQKPSDWCIKTAKESWGNIGRTGAEFCKAYSLPAEEILKLIEIEAPAQFFEDNQAGKGCIAHLGHFANWEIFGLFASLTLKKTTFLARPMSNPYIDRFVTAMRSHLGAKVISAYNPIFSCLKALKSGAFLAILSDQSVPASKVYLEFLGRPAEAGPLTALLSLKTGLPIYPARVFRKKNAQVCIKVETPLFPKEEFSEQAVENLTKELYRYYEKWIRENPCDWLWAHNRWKREEESRAALLAKGEISEN